MRSRSDIVENENKKSFLVIFLLTFGANMILFLLAGASPDSFAYGNRGLSAVWISLALLFGYVISVYRNRVVTVSILLILGLSWLAFIGERTSYIASYNLQIEIVHDILQRAEVADIPPGAVILGNVPQSPPYAFNNEDLFNNSWDFGSALTLYSDGHISRGNTISSRKIKGGQALVSPDHILLDSYFVADYTNLWIYTYQSDMNASTLKKIENVHQMEQEIKQIESMDHTETNKNWYERVLECVRTKKQAGEMRIVELTECLSK